jgi:hypothetical protein
MNAIFIFSTPQRIPEIRIAGPPNDTVGAERQSRPKGTRSRILSAAIFSVFTSRPLSMAVGPLRRIDLVVAGYWLSLARGVPYSDIRLRIFSRD